MSDTIEDPPGVVRFIPGTLDAAEMLARADAALKAGITVEFPLKADDMKPLFALCPVRGSIQVLDGRRRHLGTFADPGAAMIHGRARAARRRHRTGIEQP